MKKTLFITTDFPPDLGGVANYYKNVCAHLEADKLFILAPERKTEDNYPYRVMRKRLFFKRFWPKWALMLLRAWQAAKKIRPKIIMAGQVLPAGTVALILKKILNVPYLVFTHGMDITVPQKYPRKMKLMKKVLAEAKYVIANSRFTKKELLGLGIAGDKIAIVYPGVDMPKEDVPKIKPIALLSIGRVVKRKGFDKVIEALEKMIDIDPHIHGSLNYTIVGSGEDEKRLMKMALDKGLGGRITFAGAVSPAELPSYYASCDIFIMPSRRLANGDAEGFGIVFLEANSYGKPVIAGKSGGVGEAVIDGQTGLLVDPEDADDIALAIAKLMKDKDLRERLGRQGKERAEKEFDWKRTVKPLLKIMNPGYPADRKVSVMIPTYNNENEIARCIESVLGQTYGNIEIIAVNDGSADNTLNILQRYKDKIKIIDQANAGAPAARNRGFRESSGDYVIFSDADMVLEPDMIEKMAGVLDNNPEISYVYPSFKFGWKLFKCGPFDLEKLKKMNFIHTSALIRREHFPGFDGSVKKFQDWDLWLTMLEQGHKGYWINEVLFKVIDMKGTMSNWLPSFLYKIPWLKTVKKYDRAKEIILKKHDL